MLGKSYIIDHVFLMYRKDAEERLFKVYITDSLKILTENTAQQCGGKAINRRYADFVEKQPQETRSADEIISKIKSKLGGGEPA